MKWSQTEPVSFAQALDFFAQALSGAVSGLFNLMGLDEAAEEHGGGEVEPPAELPSLEDQFALPRTHHLHGPECGCERWE